MPAEVVFPYIEVSCPGPGPGRVSAEGIVVTAGINSAPSVEVILRRGTDTVVQPMSADMIAAMKSIQEARMKVKGEPDSAILADDGRGGTLNFVGYAVSPVLGQSKVSSEESVRIVGTDALLDALGLSIYQSREDKIRNETIEGIFKLTPSRTTGDIAKTISEVTKVLEKNYEPTLRKTPMDSAKEVLTLRHKANELPLKTWYEVLQNSDVKYEDWAKVFEKLPELGKAVVRRTKELLQQQSSSFWGVINALGSEFQFFYRPDMQGGAGKLIRADQKVQQSSPKVLDVGVIRFTASDGMASMLPLGGVILNGIVMPGIRKETKSSGSGAIVGRWPMELETGYIMEGSPPVWLARGGPQSISEFLPPKKDEPKSGGADDTKKSYDPENYKGRRETLGKHLTDIEDPISKLLCEYAKVIYEDMRLADSTATLDIPLDFTIEVGVRYRFQLGEGSGQFTGFVTRLRHSLQLQNGEQLSSGTTLSLSHILYY